MTEGSRYGKRDWKARLYNYDDALSEGGQSHRVCLSDQEIVLLLANCEYLKWKTRWYSPTGQTIDPEIILYVATEIERTLMSTDCGQALSPSSCKCIEGQHFAWLLAQADDGTINSYAPGAPDTTFNHHTDDAGEEAQSQRNAMLCKAVNAYVDNVIIELARKVGVAAATLSVINIIIGGINWVAGLVLAGISAVTIAFLDELDNDPVIIAEVKCCMLNGLMNQDNTFENFKNALFDCGFGFGSTASQLAAYVNSVSQELANYRAFNVFLGSGFGSADSEDCAYCGEWCHTLDFRDNAYSDIITIHPTESTAGSVWVDGVGYMPPTTPGDARIKIYVKLPTNAGTVVAALRATGAGTAANVYGKDRDGTDYTTWTSPAWGLSLVFTDGDLAEFGGTIFQPNGWEQMHLRGTGVNPFSFIENCTVDPW